VGFASDGKTVWTAGTDRVLRTWTLDGKALGVWEVPDAAHRFAVSPDGRTLATVDDGKDKALQLVNLVAGGAAPVRQPGGEATGALAFAPDGRTLARMIWTYREQAEGPPRVGFVPSLYDTTARHTLWVGEDVPGRVSHFVFTPDGRRILVLTMEPDPKLRIWDVKTGRELRSPLQGLVPGDNFVLSPDGTLLAFFGASRKEEWRTTAWPYQRAALQVWEMASGRLAASVDALSGRVECAALSPDGRLLAFGDGAAVRIWDVAAWSERAVLRAHEGSVTALAFAADGQMLISGARDTTALVWDLGRLPPRPLPAPLSEGQLLPLWDDLASADAARGWRAIGALAAAAEQAVPFLRERLRRPAAVTPERLRELIQDLDSVQFAIRERATEELELLGERAEKALREAAARPASPEVRRRVALLLEALRGPGPSAEELRLGRALQALRHSGSIEALRLADAVGGGR
jgi:hypothetical protein